MEVYLLNKKTGEYERHEGDAKSIRAVAKKHGVTIRENVNLEFGVHLAPGVVIDQFVFLGSGVRVGEDTHIGRCTNIFAGTTIGKKVKIGVEKSASYSSTGIGYGVRIADEVVIGRHSVINAVTSIEHGAVLGICCAVGTRCYVGKKCKLGNHVQLSNDVWLEFGVVVGGDAFLGDGIASAERNKVPAHATVPREVHLDEVFFSRPIGSRKAPLAVGLTGEGKPVAATGCFEGTLDELAERVAFDYPEGHKHRIEYDKVIAQAKKNFDIKDGK